MDELTDSTALHHMIEKQSISVHLRFGKILLAGPSFIYLDGMDIMSSFLIINF